MKKFKKITEELNKSLTKEQIEKVIYNLFCFVIFLLPIIPEKFGYAIYSLKNTIFNMFTIMTALSLLILNIKNTKYKFNVYDILVGVYLILVAVSTIFSKYGIRECILGENGRGEGVVTIFSYMATFLICMRGYKYINKTLKVGIIAAVIVSIYGIIQANTPIDIKLPFGTANSDGVAEGTMGNQNFFASYICIFLPMVCYYYLKTDKNSILILVALLFAALVYTTTLNAYTVFAIMFVLISAYVMYRNKNNEEILVKILLMVVIFIAIFIILNFFGNGIYAEEFLGLGDELENLVNSDDEFGTGRLRIWKRVVLAIKNNPVVGVGPDSLKMEFRDTRYHLEGNLDVLSCVIVDKAHCEYLHIAVTTGIPSMIIYLILIVLICKRLKKVVIYVNNENTKNENNLFITMILIGIVSYLAQAIGNVSVVQVAPAFWAILGIGAGITLHEKIVLNKLKNSKINIKLAL